MPVCDAPNCPAAAPHEVLLYGQDFHFCGHHLTGYQLEGWEVNVPNPDELTAEEKLDAEEMAEVG